MTLRGIKLYEGPSGPELRGQNNGDVLVWDDAEQTWKPGTGGGGTVAPTQHLYWLDPAFVGTSNGSIASPFTQFSEFWAIVQAGVDQDGWKLNLPASNASGLTVNANLPTLTPLSTKIVFEGFANNGGETVILELQVEPQDASPEITFRNLVLSSLVATGNGSVAGDFNIDNAQVAGVSAAAEESAWSAAFFIKNASSVSDIDAPDSLVSAVDSFLSGVFDVGIIECFQCSVGFVSLNLPDGSSNKFLNCNFTQAFAITGDCTITFDLQSWASFVRAGCTFTGTKIIVPSGVCLITSFGVPHDGDIAQGQFLAPFSSEPHAAESRCRTYIPVDYEVTHIVAHADPDGGVTGTTTFEVYNSTPTLLTSIDIATGQNDVVVTVGNLALTPGELLSCKLAVAPDAGTSTYALAIYGRPL